MPRGIDTLKLERILMLFGCNSSMHPYIHGVRGRAEVVSIMEKLITSESLSLACLVLTSLRKFN